MSKEIAQTVGGKRIAWLIAIVAAFAVFATVASRFDSAEAGFGGGTTVVCDQTPSSGAVDIGDPITYVCTITTVVASDGAGNPSITLNVDPGVVITSTVGTGEWTTCNGDLATPVSCTANAELNVGSDTITIAGTVGAGSDGTLALISGSASDAGGTPVNTVTVTNTAGDAALTAAAVTVDPATATNAVGVAHTFTFTFPAGVTCESDTNGDAVTPECVASDVILTGNLELAATNPVVVSGSDVLVTVINASGDGSGTVALSTAADDDGGFVSPSQVGTKNYVNAEIRHMSDTLGTPPAGGAGDGVIGAQEINSNVRGSRHTICTVEEDTGIDLNSDGDFTDAGDSAPVAVLLPGLTLANIVITNGGGYASTADTDPDFTDVRIFEGDGTAVGTAATSGLDGATCISWVSTDAGDQQINIVYVGADGANYNVSWDNQAVSNRSLIKEWNRLEESIITIEGVAQYSGTEPLQSVAKNYGVVLNPATGLYQLSVSDGKIDISDTFAGSHVNSAAGDEYVKSLAGVLWEIDYEGCDAAITAVNGWSGTTTLLPDGSVGNTPDLDVRPGDCIPGDVLEIHFYGQEPGPLGSGEGIPVHEIVVITFTQNIAEKQVFLAWAGQRIILEHDWRLAPGDGGSTGQSIATDGDYPTPNGTCPFDSGATSGPNNFYVQYVKGTGPGNFVAGLNAEIDEPDNAWVEVNASDNSQSLESVDLANVATDDDDDINNDPQDNCISRVLYESEDPGEVDIEAFAYADCDEFECNEENYTKVAFVVYYMKINTINVSLVTQVSKPSHNSSFYADYAPGNPWDASKDDADNATEWNVSKDLLVRGRVTGWFVNSNPSGRAADTSNPLNVLPANRWVMPQDWPLLAGGPGDPADGSDAIGTAEQFRPYYDIMFAPNNTRNLALGSPSGLGAIEVTAVTTGSTGKGSYLNSTVNSPIRVASCLDLPTGRTIYFGASSTPYQVWACASGFLFVDGTGPWAVPPATASGLASAPAVGTPIYYTTGYVPFEGPFSLLDIVGLAAEGKGGAALSNYNPPYIRDTANDDGDVDMWDAPMPPAPVSVALRGTGFIKEVYKADTYYNGTPNTLAQVFPNPYYIENIPGSPFIPAVVAGGGYLWNSWGNDGPGGNGQGVYWYWEAVRIGTNSEGTGELTSTTSTDGREIALIREAYDDYSIARDLVVMSDNHGEFMVTANGDFKTDLTACTTNVLAGGKHCKPGDKVGTGTITATVDYPDFRGKHFPVLSNAATVTWTWGGYKDVTVEAGETDQYKYIVFHGMDRDGFCSDTTGLDAVLLHSVLSANLPNYLGMTDQDTEFTIANMSGSAPSNARHNNDPIENVDFLIDSGEGIIIGSSDPGADISEGKQFATDVWTFSTAQNDPTITGIKEFPLSSLAASGATDECQAWIKVSNSLLGVLNVLAIANDDEGNIGFDKIIDLTNTTSYTLNFRWSLVTWAGADAIPVADALKGTGKNTGGNDISASVTAIYGWDAASQQWLGYFPSGVNVPGANDLVSLQSGQAYWIAITGPSSVTWTIASNVN